MEKFISEECYKDIVEMAAQMVVESVINELNLSTEEGALKERERRTVNAGDTADLLAAIGSKGAKEAEKRFQDSVKKFTKDKEHVEKRRAKETKANENYYDTVINRAVEIIAEAILNETSSGLKKALLQGRAQQTREAQHAADVAHAKNAQIDADVLSHKVSDDAFLKKVNTAKVDANLKAAKAKEKRANSLVDALENRPSKVTTSTPTPKMGRKIDW